MFIFQVNKLDPESESPQTQRLGRIYIHNVDIENLEKLSSKDAAKNGANSNHISEENGGKFCTKACTLDCPAVLDLKWNLKSADTLGAVNASGQLAIYHYNEEDKILKGKRLLFLS